MGLSALEVAARSLLLPAPIAVVMGRKPGAGSGAGHCGADTPAWPIRSMRRAAAKRDVGHDLPTQTRSTGSPPSSGCVARIERIRSIQATPLTPKPKQKRLPHRRRKAGAADQANSLTARSPVHAVASRSDGLRVSTGHPDLPRHATPERTRQIGSNVPAARRLRACRAPRFIKDHCYFAAMTMISTSTLPSSATPTQTRAGGFFASTQAFQTSFIAPLSDMSAR